jgi:hypothetical protein
MRQNKIYKKKSHMKKVIAKIFFITLLLNFQFFAQAKSIYSKFGLGLLNFNFDGRTTGMAGSAIAMSDGLSANYTNPASWSFLKNVKFQGGARFDFNKLESDDKSAFYSQSDINAFVLGFPIYRNYGISFGSGILPYATTNYEIKNKRNPNYLLTQKGKGSTSKVFAGFSSSLLYDFKIGISYDYYLGNYFKKSNAEFYDQESFYASSNIKYTYYGSGLTFGFISKDLSEIFSFEILNELRFGAAFSTSFNIKLDSLEKISGNPTAEFDKAKNIKSNLPDRFSAGLKAKISKSYTLLSDFIYQNWADFKIGNRNDEKYSGEYNRYSIGIEYNKSKKSLAFSDYIIYRAGASFAKLPYDFNGKQLNQIGLNFGLAYPIGYESYIDIGLEIGRNIADKNLIDETFFKFVFSINYSEIWFQKSER